MTGDAPSGPGLSTDGLHDARPATDPRNVSLSATGDEDGGVGRSTHTVESAGCGGRIGVWGEHPPTDVGETTVTRLSGGAGVNASVGES